MILNKRRLILASAVALFMSPMISATAYWFESTSDTSSVSVYPLPGLNRVGVSTQHGMEGLEVNVAADVDNADHFIYRDNNGNVQCESTSSGQCEIVADPDDTHYTLEAYNDVWGSGTQADGIQRSVITDQQEVQLEQIDVYRWMKPSLLARFRASGQLSNDFGMPMVGSLTANDPRDWYGKTQSSATFGDQTGVVANTEMNFDSSTNDKKQFAMSWWMRNQTRFSDVDYITYGNDFRIGGSTYQRWYDTNYDTSSVPGWTNAEYVYLNGNLHPWVMNNDRYAKPIGPPNNFTPLGNFFLRKTINFPRSGTYRICYLVDNIGELWVDGKRRGSVSFSITGPVERCTNVAIGSGQHTVAMRAGNAGSVQVSSNPSAAFISVQDLSGNVLARSDTSWKMYRGPQRPWYHPDYSFIQSINDLPGGQPIGSGEWNRPCIYSYTPTSTNGYWYSDVPSSLHGVQSIAAQQRGCKSSWNRYAYARVRLGPKVAYGTNNEFYFSCSFECQVWIDGAYRGSFKGRYYNRRPHKITFNGRHSNKPWMSADSDDSVIAIRFFGYPQDFVGGVIASDGSTHGKTTNANIGAANGNFFTYKPTLNSWAFEENEATHGSNDLKPGNAWNSEYPPEQDVGRRSLFIKMGQSEANAAAFTVPNDNEWAHYYANVYRDSSGYACMEIYRNGQSVGNHCEPTVYDTGTVPIKIGGNGLEEFDIDDVLVSTNQDKLTWSGATSGRARPRILDFIDIDRPDNDDVR